MKVHGTIRRGQNKEADEASVAVVEVDEALEVDGDERAGERARNPPGVNRPPRGLPAWATASPPRAAQWDGEGIGRSALNGGVTR